MTLPETITSARSAAEHRSDHEALHVAYNAGGSPSVGIFNVMAYGAVGDGTTNDIAAIRAAVAACDAAGGGDVYFPPGQTFVVKTAGSYEDVLTPTVGNIRFLGGKGSVLKVDATNADGPVMITASGTTGLQVEGLTFDMSSKVGGLAVKLAGSAFNKVCNCVFFNVGTAGVYLVDDSTDTQIENNTFQGAGYGVLTQDAATSTRVNIVNNIFNGAGGVGDGIALNSPSGGAIDWNIVGNIITSYGSSSPEAGFGISMARGTNVNIIGNTIHNTELEGVHIEDGSIGINVSGNTFRSCVQGAIYIVTGNSVFENFLIADNIIRECSTAAHDYSGAIWAAAGGAYLFENVTIANNQLDGCGNVASASCAGIRMDGDLGARNLNVTGNTVRNQKGTISGKGIGIIVGGDDLYTYTKQIAVTNNICAGNAWGMWLTHVQNNLLCTGNMLAENTTGSLTLPTGTYKIFNNIGYKSEAEGATSVADGGTITHGLGQTGFPATPTVVTVTPSTTNEFVSVTAKSSTTFTVAIKKDDGTAGTTAVVYWRASV